MRALTRKPEKTKQLFDNHPNLEVGVTATAKIPASLWPWAAVAFYFVKCSHLGQITLQPGLRTSNSQNAHEDQAYEYPLDVSRLSILDMQNGLAANVSSLQAAKTTMPLVRLLLGTSSHTGSLEAVVICKSIFSCH